MDFIRLNKSEPHQKFVNKIVKWYYHWWGIRDNFSLKQVKEIVHYSLNDGIKLPQTFAVIDKGKILGTLCIAMSDDLYTRVDIYPWLANVYVDEKFRKKGVAKFMLKKVPLLIKELKINELFLYTKHQNFYEKFGWKFVENVNTYRTDSPIEKLYVLKQKMEN